MNSHKNARLTPHGRELLVRRVLEQGLRPEEAAQAMGVSVRTAYKWLKRFREEGRQGLQDRSSRPNRCPHAIGPEQRTELVRLRSQRWTYRQISQRTGVPASTVARLLRRLGLNRLARVEPAEPVQRYEYDRPGGLLHLDIKKLARFHKPGHRVTGHPKDRHSRGAGWEYVHVAIDDHSRVAFSAIQPDERAESACAFLIQAVKYYRSLGIRFERVLTDNGPCYTSRAFRRLCKQMGIKHIRTRPYTPRTNGKAERFIQTALREWAYARSYGDSKQRAAHLPYWVHNYNWHRPHASLDYKPPISRLALNNVVSLHN